MQLIELEQIIARLKNTPPFLINGINELTDTLEPAYTISSSVIDDLIVTEADLDTQISIISGQIQEWGRLRAMAQRAMVVAARHYRQWKGRKILEYITPNPADKAWKKPTEAVQEAMYRTDREYVLYQIVMERTEESYNASNMVLEGFKAKLEMLKVAAKRTFDLGMARQAV